MELYFTDHCRSARGRLQSDMISHQSGEKCAMQVWRSQGTEREGKERMSSRAALHRHITSHLLWAPGMRSRRKKQPHQIPNSTALLVYLHVAVSFFFLYLHICVSLSVSCSVSLTNCCSLCGCNALSSARLLSFFIFFVLFISRKSGVTALCVISPALVV